MNDIEKNFQESLRHHEVTPPPAVWDQLSGSLVQKRQKKAVYWRVAAAVALLLLGTGTLVMLLRSEPVPKTVTQREQPAALDSKESLNTPSGREKTIDSVKTDLPSDAKKAASTALAGSAPSVKKREEYLSENNSGNALASQTDSHPARVRPVGEPERLRVAALPPTVPKVTNASPSTTPVYEVLPSAEVRLDRSVAEELASLDAPPTAAVAQRRTVTVIYKPGNRSPKTAEINQNDKFLSKTLSFLEDVKKNGLAFSELRSAKSELIDNVFSRDQNDKQ